MTSVASDEYELLFLWWKSD